MEVIVKKINSWRKWLIIIVMMFSALAANAQEGLSVAKVFELYGHAKGCKMVEMNNTNIRGYELKVYKSLSYKTIGANVAPYLEADRKKAKKIREVVNDGHITSGYYMMPPVTKGTNRYVLFSKVSEKQGTVIYIEGTLEPNDIMKLCYSKK